MTPEALHQLWAAKWGTDDNGSVAWRGDNQGTVREKLLRDVYAYLELPDAEADALVEDWKRRVAGLDVAGYKVAGKRDEFVRKLQEKRVRAIAEGDFE